MICHFWLSPGRVWGGHWTGSGVCVLVTGIWCRDGKLRVIGFADCGLWPEIERKRGEERKALSLSLCLFSFLPFLPLFTLNLPLPFSFSFPLPYRSLSQSWIPCPLSQFPTLNAYKDGLESPHLQVLFLSFLPHYSQSTASNPLHQSLFF
ncbi:hypothetical protein HOY82DRAFT_194497 [Tuber indicum]|nr:hypothetical protein HOY82DRAFT_194497 [Tuber indicum]